MKTIVLSLVLGFGITAQGVMAQVVPDNTVGTIVSPTNLITGGTRTGNNLFHSFTQFSIPTGGSAIFNNPTDIQNIFSRVTGTTQSSIDGLIKAQGNANLFLMNPNGILFGPNAKLDIGGSFVGTTANSIKFADGVNFSARDTTTNPLLTVSLPIGLQMGNNPGTITVNGPGNSLLRPSIFIPASFANRPLGFNLNSGGTLALIGNGINLSGGILDNPSGHIELGSITGGEVGLTRSLQGLGFDYTNVTGLNDIHLTQTAFINASGNSGGSIRLKGKDIKLQDSSRIFIQNLGRQDAGPIVIEAAGLLELRDIFPNRDQTAIASETINTGAASNIFINANQVKLLGGSNVLTVSFLAGGKGGDISVQAKDSIVAIGVSPFNPIFTSNFAAVSNIGGGKGGNIMIASPRILLQDGGSISTPVLGGMQGGDINVTSDRIEIAGESVIGGSSVITSATFFGGNAGKIQVNTKQLLLQAGGGVTSSTLGAANAGELVINASESVVISGIGKLGTPSRIAASGEILNPLFQRAFGLPPMPTGNAGSLQLNTPYLEVNNGAGVLVNHVGTGSTGTLSINANVISLNQGTIQASTKSGRGGNISLTVDKSLVLRSNSEINATAGGIGVGGNILIKAPILVGLENSDIIANAFQGNGGNIQITTQSIFGLKYRDRLTTENDITASSEFGINGTVQVNSLGLDPSSGLVKLDGDVIDSSRSISKGCNANQGNSFISTGRGGIPQAPKNKTDRSWTDMRLLPTSNVTAVIQSINIPIVEAVSIQKNSDGSIALINGSSISVNSGETCAIGEYSTSHE